MKILHIAKRLISIDIELNTERPEGAHELNIPDIGVSILVTIKILWFSPTQIYIS